MLALTGPTGCASVSVVYRHYWRVMMLYRPCLGVELDAFNLELTLCLGDHDAYYDDSNGAGYGFGRVRISFQSDAMKYLYACICNCMTSEVADIW